MQTNRRNRVTPQVGDTLISKGLFGACCLYMGIALSHIEAIRNINLSYFIYAAVVTFFLSWLARK